MFTGDSSTWPAWSRIVSIPAELNGSRTRSATALDRPIVRRFPRSPRFMGPGPFADCHHDVLESRFRYRIRSFWSAAPVLALAGHSGHSTVSLPWASRPVPAPLTTAIAHKRGDRLLRRPVALYHSGVDSWTLRRSNLGVELLRLAVNLGDYSSPSSRTRLSLMIKLLSFSLSPSVPSHWMVCGKDTNSIAGG